MISFNNYISLITLGILLVILIDTAGSVTSRKLNFNYMYFTFFSIIAYTFIGYKASIAKGLAAALIITLIMGVFDATVGWEISKKLHANFGKYSEKSLTMSLNKRLQSVLFFSLLSGFIGHLIAVS